MIPQKPKEKVKPIKSEQQTGLETVVEDTEPPKKVKRKKTRKHKTIDIPQHEDDQIFTKTKWLKRIKTRAIK